MTTNLASFVTLLASLHPVSITCVLMATEPSSFSPTLLSLECTVHNYHFPKIALSSYFYPNSSIITVWTTFPPQTGSPRYVELCGEISAGCDLSASKSCVSEPAWATSWTNMRWLAVSRPSLMAVAGLSPMTLWRSRSWDGEASRGYEAPSQLEPLMAITDGWLAGAMNWQYNV